LLNELSVLRESWRRAGLRLRSSGSLLLNELLGLLLESWWRTGLRLTEGLSTKSWGRTGLGLVGDWEGSCGESCGGLATNGSSISRKSRRLLRLSNSRTGLSWGRGVGKSVQVFLGGGSGRSSSWEWLEEKTTSSGCSRCWTGTGTWGGARGKSCGAGTGSLGRSRAGLLGSTRPFWCNGAGACRAG
jgi:hypothetical protein